MTNLDCVLSTCLRTYTPIAHSTFSLIAQQSRLSPAGMALKATATGDGGMKVESPLAFKLSVSWRTIFLAQKNQWWFHLDLGNIIGIKIPWFHWCDPLGSGPMHPSCYQKLPGRDSAFGPWTRGRTWSHVKLLPHPKKILFPCDTCGAPAWAGEMDHRLGAWRIPEPRHCADPGLIC